jgi:DEAD/DEAH box helicase domain-containing protein
VHHVRGFREFGYIPGENRHDRLANDLENLITLCPSCHQRAESARGARSALSGLAHALGNIAPLFLMCDPRDLGTTVELRAKGTRAPTITLYDRVPEGLGLAERLYDLHADLLRGAGELVEGCVCLDGCPACVGPVGPGGGQVKTLTIQLARALSSPQNPIEA